MTTTIIIINSTRQTNAKNDRKDKQWQSQRKWQKHDKLDKTKEMTIYHKLQEHDEKMTTKWEQHDNTKHDKPNDNKVTMERQQYSTFFLDF